MKTKWRHQGHSWICFSLMFEPRVLRALRAQESAPSVSFGINTCLDLEHASRISAGSVTGFSQQRPCHRRSHVHVHGLFAAGVFAIHSCAHAGPHFALRAF